MVTSGLIDIAVLRRIYEIGLPALLLVSAARSFRTRGAPLTLRELAFGFLLSQSVELIAVALGRYRYPDWLLYFPPKPAWVPLGIGLGWGALVPCVMRVSERILGHNASPIRLAVLDGAMAMGLDLVLDPVVSGEPLRMWLWQGEGMTPYRFWLLGVPVFNFVGWFLLIGGCSLELRWVEANKTGARAWLWLGVYLAIDLLVAFAVMHLPW